MTHPLCTNHRAIPKDVLSFYSWLGRTWEKKQGSCSGLVSAHGAQLLRMLVATKHTSDAFPHLRTTPSLHPQTIAVVVEVVEELISTVVVVLAAVVVCSIKARRKVAKLTERALRLESFASVSLTPTVAVAAAASASCLYAPPAVGATDASLFRSLESCQHNHDHSNVVSTIR